MQIQMQLAMHHVHSRIAVYELSYVYALALDIGLVANTIIVAVHHNG